MAGKINEVVVVNISRDTRTVSQAGFGTAMLLGATTAIVDRVKSYSSASELLDDGFGESNVLYQAALTHMAQSKTPESFYVGRKGVANKNCTQRLRLNAAATAGTFTLTLDGQTTAPIAFDAAVGDIATAIEALSNVDADGVTVTQLTASQDWIVAFDVNNANKPFELMTADITGLTGPVSASIKFSYGVKFDAAGTAGTFTLTINGEETGNINWDDVREVNKENIADAIKALDGIYADDVDVTIITADTEFYLEFLDSNKGITISTFTADVSALTGVTTPTYIAAEQGQETETWTAALTACRAFNDDWYELATPELSSQSDVSDQYDLAVAIEAADVDKLYAINTTYSSTKSTSYDASTPDDIAEKIKANSIDKSFVVYTDKLNEYKSEGISGRQLPKTPGSSSWFAKSIASVTTDDLSATEKSNLESKSCNYYQYMGGQNWFMGATVGSGEYIDIIRGIDFITARVSEDLFALVGNLEKLPYTLKGFAQIEATLRSSLQTYGVETGILANGSVTITMPDITTIPDADKAARIVRNIKFSGTLQGAVHKMYIDGNVTV